MSHFGPERFCEVAQPLVGRWELFSSVQFICPPTPVGGCDPIGVCAGRFENSFTAYGTRYRLQTVLGYNIDIVCSTFALLRFRLLLSASAADVVFVVGELVLPVPVVGGVRHEEGHGGVVQKLRDLARGPALRGGHHKC